MERIETDCITGARKVVPLTSEELALAQALAEAEAAENTPDKCAARAIAAMDRLQFEVLFSHENRIRVLEGKLQITVEVFRDALIARWKALHQ